MKKGLIVLTHTLMVSVLLTGCYEEELVVVEDWETNSHSIEAAADYATVFNDSKVNRFDIVIEQSDWNDMQKDLESIVGSSGSGPGGTVEFSDETPMYVPCDLYFNDILWPHVGIRYKGNSSLQAYSRGANKLPFRLEFDKFENDFPEIKDMRFYGFKELSLSSNFDDPSLLREKVAPDLFRSFGVPAPRTAFYEIYIDYGDGPMYFGVYTAVEVVFDTPMLSTQFTESTGNCYKPDGLGAAFSISSFDLDDIDIKNYEYSDKADIQELFDVLHSSDREDNPELWRSEFESVFDVQGYLKYLAVNTTIQNWDTYGRMTHNYYLYHDPSDDLIKWIPWDNNEAFQTGKQGGSLSFSFSEVNERNWPIIMNIINDEEYKLDYDNYVKTFINTTFNANRMAEIYRAEESIVSHSAQNENSEYTYLSNGSITSAVNSLISHADARNSSAQAYLDAQ